MLSHVELRKPRHRLVQVTSCQVMGAQATQVSCPAPAPPSRASGTSGLEAPSAFPMGPAPDLGSCDHQCVLKMPAFSALSPSLWASQGLTWNLSPATDASWLQGKDQGWNLLGFNLVDTKQLWKTESPL